VRERANIAALPLQEIGLGFTLPGLVVFEHGRGGNGIGVIRKEGNDAAAMAIVLPALERMLVHLSSSRQMGWKDFCLMGAERHRPVKDQGDSKAE